MVNRTHRNVLLVMVLAGGALLACVSERGVQPEPEQYRLYVSTWGWNNRVYQVAEKSLVSVVLSSFSELLIAWWVSPALLRVC